MPIIPHSVGDEVINIKSESKNFQLSTLSIILIAVGAVVAIYLFILFGLRYRKLCTPLLPRTSRIKHPALQRSSLKAESLLRKLKEIFPTIKVWKIKLAVKNPVQENSSAAQDFLQNRKGSLTTSITDPNLSDATITASSNSQEAPYSSNVSQKRKKSAAGILPLESIADVNPNDVSLHPHDSDKKQISIHHGSEYPLPRRYSISDWMRFMEDVISLTKPMSNLKQYPQENYVSFEDIKAVRELNIKAESVVSKNKLSIANEHLLEESRNMISKALKTSSTLASLPQNTEKAIEVLKEHLKSIIPEPSMYIRPKELLVDYMNTLGEDPYGALHLGLCNSEVNHVQCYSALINGCSDKDDTSINDAVIWTKKDIANIWLKEITVMRALLNNENALELRGASVLCHKDVLYCFIAYEQGKPLAELIFNFDIDWYDDDAMYLACDIMSSLAYAHDLNLFGGLTLLDVWLIPKARSQTRIFSAKIGGHFGAPSEFLKKRRDTSTEPFRQHIYTRYLETSDVTSKQNDMYSCGMLIYESLERMPGFALFSKEKIIELLEEKKRPSINLQRSLANAALRHQHCGHSRGLRVKLIELLTRCWSKELRRRPTAKSALSELLIIEESSNC